MNAKNKKAKTPPAKKTRSKQLKDNGIVRTTIDLTAIEKNKVNELNKGYVHTRGGFFKPLAEAILIRLGEHPDREEIMKSLFRG